MKPPSWRQTAPPAEPAVTEPAKVSVSEPGPRLKGFSVVVNKTAGEASKVQRQVEAAEESGEELQPFTVTPFTVFLVFKHVWLNSVIKKGGNAPGGGEGAELINPTHTRKYSRNSVSVSKTRQL